MSIGQMMRKSIPEMGIGVALMDLMIEVVEGLGAMESQKWKEGEKFTMTINRR